MWSRYGWGFDEVVAGRRAWNLVALLVDRVVKDTYSDLYASLRGWGYAPNPMDAFFLDWVDAQAVMHHRPGKVMPQPVRRPWESASKQRVPTDDPTRSERRKALRERLGLLPVDAPVVVDGEDHALGLPIEGTVDDEDQP